MPKADWKKCAVCTALPTTQTSASQPDTGNGSVGGVVLDQPDQLLELVEVEVGEALLVVEGLLEAHGSSSCVGDRVSPHCTPVAAAAQADAPWSWSMPVGMRSG